MARMSPRWHADRDADEAAVDEEGVRLGCAHFRVRGVFKVYIPTVILPPGSNSPLCKIQILNMVKKSLIFIKIGTIKICRPI